MNFELYIENLGAIEKAEITINPLTILAGENGTGKSFVTKFLYSVLNVLMRDVYRIELNKSIQSSLDYFAEIKDFWESGNDDGFLELFGFLNISVNSDISFNKFKELLLKYDKEVGLFLENFKKSIAEHNYNNTIEEILDPLSFKYAKTEKLFALNSDVLNYIYQLLENQHFEYFNILKKYLVAEIKSNFQISNISQLIKNKKERIIFNIKGIIDIEIFGNELKINQKYQSMDNIININRLVFFESPIYWRLSMELIENASRPKNYYLSDKISDERLTGVPKYFLDLRELLFSRFEKGEKEPFVEQCANDLQKNLNGKFNTGSYDLSFETNQGQTINKTLVSFGMTNLGILQAVLNKNIINKGSFVFIDEPESNLHPEWQAVLADILVKLAENGVFVVITTHSSDMLKALDVISQERKNNDEFISVNYFEKGGNLLPLNNNDISPIQQARLKLLETYDEMVLRGYLL